MGTQKSSASSGQRRVQQTRKGGRTRLPIELDLRTPSGRVLPW